MARRSSAPRNRLGEGHHYGPPVQSDSIDSAYLWHLAEQIHTYKVWLQRGDSALTAEIPADAGNSLMADVAQLLADKEDSSDMFRRGQAHKLLPTSFGALYREACALHRAAMNANLPEYKASGEVGTHDTK